MSKLLESWTAAVEVAEAAGFRNNVMITLLSWLKIYLAMHNICGKLQDLVPFLFSLLSALSFTLSFGPCFKASGKI